MTQESKFADLEDTLQYALAQKAGCEAIISNDKNFFSPKIELFTSEQFCQKQRIII
jgi:predicted nucleic acid-binding protein